MFDFSASDNRFSHMPFAACGGDGSPHEFCCIQCNGLWKLHRRQGRKWRRIQTGLPDDATECGPTAEWEDGMWKVSFIAGGWKGDRRFRLYRMYGIDSEPMAQGFADIGFVRKDAVAMAGRIGPIVIRQPSGQPRWKCLMSNTSTDSPKTRGGRTGCSFRGSSAAGESSRGRMRRGWTNSWR